jgi:hypothetical protein
MKKAAPSTEVIACHFFSFRGNKREVFGFVGN